MLNRFLPIYFLLIFIIISSGSLIYFYFRCEYYKKSFNQLQSQMEIIKQQAEYQNSRYEQMRKEAQEEIKKASERANEVLLAEIPKDCNDATKWAIEQAKNFQL